MEKCITKETIYAHIPIHLGLFMCHTFIICYFIVYLLHSDASSEEPVIELSKDLEK